MKLELNAKLVAELELPAGKPEEVCWDIKQPGLGLRLRRGAGNGVVKTWIVQRKKYGRAVKVKIGGADVFGIDAARRAAKQTLAKIDLGGNPAAEARDQAAKKLRKMSALASEYLEHKKRRVRPRSFVEIKRYLEANFKSLHGMPVDAIRRGDVSSRVATIERETGSATAREARQALGAFFAWAITMGYTDNNPVINSFRPAAVKVRDRVLADAELVAIWNACGDDDHGRIIKLLTLTGCRRNEIGDACWSEIDFNRETFTIPAERSKNKREHTLPLMPMALGIIKSVPRTTRPQLFGTRGPTGFTTWHKSKRALDKRLGNSVKPWRLHDVRRSVATKMADIGIAPHIIEQILNHQSGHKAGPAGIYNRSSYEREVKAALALWEDHIRALIEGGERKVVNFQPQTAS